VAVIGIVATLTLHRLWLDVGFRGR
jgi:hypothetical protein